MKQLIAWSLFLLTLLASTSSFAQPDATRGMSAIHVDDHHNRCAYIYDRWDCDNTNGCRWNNYDNYCESDYGDGYRQCHDINSPLECSNRSDCYWSTSQYRCVATGGGGGGGGGGGSPRRCYNIRSPRECNNTYNCHWSHAYDRCVGSDDI